MLNYSFHYHNLFYFLFSYFKLCDHILFIHCSFQIIFCMKRRCWNTKYQWCWDCYANPPNVELAVTVSHSGWLQYFSVYLLGKAPCNIFHSVVYHFQENGTPASGASATCCISYGFRRPCYHSVCQQCLSHVAGMRPLVGYSFVGRSNLTQTWLCGWMLSVWAY